MPMRCRPVRNTSQQPSLFLRPPEGPRWDQFPDPCRREVKRLLIEMFVAHVVSGPQAQAAGLATEREGAHE